ncbi:hypothetical protein C8259_31265 [Nocardia nova]|uniref:Uncharacterized protein n=1 Tax=Nocardia nova TaxID=37330 RepID=A0A2T2YRS8_9NOCA|nr:hypothetical protein C8259_31265 [Nocardia nova]
MPDETLGKATVFESSVLSPDALSFAAALGAFEPGAAARAESAAPWPVAALPASAAFAVFASSAPFAVRSASGAAAGAFVFAGPFAAADPAEPVAASDLPEFSEAGALPVSSGFLPDSSRLGMATVSASPAPSLGVPALSAPAAAPPPLDVEPGAAAGDLPEPGAPGPPDFAPEAFAPDLSPAAEFACPAAPFAPGVRMTWVCADGDGMGVVGAAPGS